MNTTAAAIEIAIAQWFGPRRNLCVPNVSWGLGVHECDLFVVSDAGFATEVEIKISKSDLVKDKEKRHQHSHAKIKYLYFALPSKLAPHIDLVPARAGILIVNSKGRVYEIAKPRANAGAHKLTEDERFKVARLGCLRIWSLKEKIRDLKENKK